MFESLDLLILGVVAIGALFLQGYLSAKERKQLISRIMSKSNEEYEFYQEQFKGEVKELKDQRDEVKKKTSEDEEIKDQMDLEYKKEKEFIKKADEDWPEEEVDLPELRKRINKA